MSSDVGEARAELGYAAERLTGALVLTQKHTSTLRAVAAGRELDERRTDNLFAYDELRRGGLIFRTLAGWRLTRAGEDALTIDKQRKNAARKLARRAKRPT